ncbi:MAG: DsbC/DsbD-like thiol-disulfide interchange protein [Verrucomicrobiales bacterium]|jgi:DsbC/DsbD-like thiol-disulfide interchange protein
MHRILSLPLQLYIIGLLSSSLPAAPVRSGAVEAELISASDTIAFGTPIDVAIRLKIANHWHVYWENPGDSGTPVKVKWEQPEAAAVNELLFPVPKEYETAGFVTFGHEGEVLLLTQLELVSNLPIGTVLPVKARVSWLACDPSRCVPGRAELNLRVTVAKSTKGNASTKKIQVAREALPVPSKSSAKASQAQLQVTIQVAQPWETGWKVGAFFPSQPGLFKVNDPRPKVTRKDATHVEIVLEKTDDDSTALPSEIRGVLQTPDGSLLINAKVTKPPQ